MVKKSISFFLFLSIPIFAGAQVVINEIGWAGTKASASDEWLELYNYGDAEENLDGWSVKAKDGAPQIALHGSIFPHGFYLIERTSSTTISNTDGDFVGSFGKNGSVSNSGEDLELINEKGAVIDRVYFSSGWPYGSASPDYKSMERSDPQKDGSDISNWQSNNGLKINGKDAVGSFILGTPRQENSVFKKSVSEPDNQTPQNVEGSENSSANQSGESTIFNNSNYYSFNRKTIKSIAGENRVAVAGASAIFKGEAIGLKNELLTENVKFVWSFGDGSFKEGKNVSHVYFFPGEYIAVLDVASGEYAASDKVLVRVAPNKVKISEISPFNSWVELYNDSEDVIDVSSWILTSGGKEFIFPNNTFIKSKSFLVIPSQVSFLNLDKSGGEVRFLYPNGSLATSFFYKEGAANEESFSVIDGAVLKSIGTPGEKNKLGISSFQQLAQKGAQKATGKPRDNIIKVIKNSGKKSIFINDSTAFLPAEGQKKYHKENDKRNNNFAGNVEFRKENDIGENNPENSGSSKQEEGSSLVTKTNVGADSAGAVLISPFFKFSKYVWLIIVFGISGIAVIILLILKKF